MVESVTGDASFGVVFAALNKGDVRRGSAFLMRWARRQEVSRFSLRFWGRTGVGWVCSAPNEMRILHGELAEPPVFSRASWCECAAFPSPTGGLRHTHPTVWRRHGITTLDILEVNPS